MTVKEYNISVDEYSDNLFGFALKHLRNEMSAKDVVQETFTKVWIKQMTMRQLLLRTLSTS